MSLYRIRLDLSFKNPLTPEAKLAVDNLEIAIKATEKFRVNINDSGENQELSSASKHICHHDEGFYTSCESDQVI